MKTVLSKRLTREEIVRQAISGVDVALFYELTETLKKPEKDLARIINTSLRTIHNKVNNKESFDPQTGERLLKLKEMYALGIEYFGNVELFEKWLSEPSWVSNEKHIALLRTSGGIDLVVDEIERIAQGYVI